MTAADVKFLLLGTIVAKCTLCGRFELGQKAPKPDHHAPQLSPETASTSVGDPGEVLRVGTAEGVSIRAH